MTSQTILTFSLQEEAEQRRRCGDSLVVVVIVVNWQQVPMDVGVAHQQIYIGDSVHMLQKAIELVKTAWLGAIKREAPELCSKLA